MSDQQEQKEIYRYSLKSTGGSSSKYGTCEVCKQHVAEVFAQYEERHYKFEHDGETFEGWTYNKCHSYFGHKDCLLSKRR